MSRSTSDCVDTMWIQHASGGRSYFKTKAYEQGRVKWQGWTGDGIWFDEEPPDDIYSEALTRLAVKQGMALLTMTPLLGATEVVGKFYPVPTTDERFLVQMTLDEAEHYTAAERKALIESWPEHEREARGEGRPMMGEGLIFPVTEDSIVVEPFEIPGWWPQIAGIDFGYNHPTAAAQLAYDPDHDRIFVHNEYARKAAEPVDHAPTLRQWGSWLPWSWPHDGHRIEEKDSDTQMASVYRREGLRMLMNHAMFPDGSTGVWFGLNEMLSRMRTDRWKVFSTCKLWLGERRQYHKKVNAQGVPGVVRKYDDVISASRYAFMQLRSARARNENSMTMQSAGTNEYDPLRNSRAGYSPYTAAR